MENKFFKNCLFIIIIFVVGFFLIKNPSRPPLIKGGENPSDKGDIGGYSNIKYVKIAGQNVKVDLAMTRAELMQGLSGRSGLRENEGMLFIFPESGRYTFWMKDMNFAIDIIWLTEDMKVVYIKKDARPESYPEMYGPESASKYVLEVVSGFSGKNNLQAGDRVEFIYQ